MFTHSIFTGSVLWVAPVSRPEQRRYDSQWLLLSTMYHIIEGILARSKGIFGWFWATYPILWILVFCLLALLFWHIRQATPKQLTRRLDSILINRLTYINSRGTLECWVNIGLSQQERDSTKTFVSGPPSNNHQTKQRGRREAGRERTRPRDPGDEKLAA